ncbi:putative E3 ubiquitin-protein ligase DTX3 [Lithobates pipiens]
MFRKITKVRDRQTAGGGGGGQRDGQAVGGQRDGQSGILGSPGYDIGGEGYSDQEEEEKLMERGHPILVRTLPSEKNLALKLLKYFGSNSKSGGGECDVTRVDGQTYCAIFHNQDDQRRVLGRDHIIEITVPVTVHDIGRGDVARIRQLSGDEERMKMLQQLAVRIPTISRSGSSAATQKVEEPDTCPICQCEIEDKVLLEKCKHAYCRDCLKRAAAHKPVCAICGVPYGTVIGDQPDGTMNVNTNKCTSLPGYPGWGTIEIYYNIPSGIQKENHPRPGRRFSGTSRTAYLPDNQEGKDVLRLLRRAFDQRLIFTVGDSRTTGASDTVTWNDIHHKTSMTGGPQGFGYPDPDYLTRVRDELRAKGIE